MPEHKYHKLCLQNFKINFNFYIVNVTNSVNYY